MQSCKTPNYKQVEVIEKKSPLESSVQFYINDVFDPNTLDCITIGELKDESNNSDYKNFNKVKLIRKSLSGSLNSKNYDSVKLSRIDYILANNKNINTPDLLDKIDCNAIITGKILNFKNKYYVSYSVTTVEIYLELIDKSRTVLWSARHAANSHEGSIPISPIALLTGVFVATTNRQDEVALQMIDTVSRRVISTLPDRKEINLSYQIVDNSIEDSQNIFNKIILKKPSITSVINNPQTLLAKGAYEESLTLSKQLIIENSSILENYYYASKAELLLKNYPSSIDYALTAISKGYNNAEVFSSLGIAYLKNENIRLAGAAFQKAYDINPDNSLINFNIAVINETQNNWLNSSQSYYNSGLLSIKENNKIRLYKSLKNLKRLSKIDKSINKLYIELGSKASDFLKLE